MNLGLRSQKILHFSQFISRKMSSIPKISRLVGKVAVVTASTEGIGFAIAKRLSQEGAKVLVSSRKEKNVNKAVETLKSEGLDVSGIVCHVGNHEDRKKLFDEAVSKYGGIDILVSNAGINPVVDAVLNTDEQSWDKIFEINVKASFLLAKEVLPFLRKRHNGKIVFVSSIAGYQPIDLLGAYSVSKTALLGLTKAAATQLAPENITVNCVAPGVIKTKFASFLTDTQAASDVALSKIPMERFGSTDEVAGVVAFLVSDDASYITGETIVPAGGYLSRL